MQGWIQARGALSTNTQGLTDIHDIHQGALTKPVQLLGVGEATKDIAGIRSFRHWSSSVPLGVRLGPAGSQA